MRTSIARFGVLIVLGIALLPAQGADARKTTVMVPMHDGVRLATDIYLPDSPKGPFPVILMRTPYNKAGGKGFANSAVQKGYVLVAQDMRGRFASEGNDSIVFLNDGWGKRRDGQETIEWIVRQLWCNGSVGTYGGSALGITQTMMAPGARPPSRRNTCKWPSTTCIRRGRTREACGGNR